MSFNDRITLGKTGLKAGRLGISSSFGAPASAFEEAFERGCNYFTWGTFIKGRSKEMAKAIRNIKGKGKGDDLILALWSYAHEPAITELFLRKGLKALNLDFADVLLLGYFPSLPSRRIIEGALKLKERGLVRFIGISGHERTAFPGFANEEIFDIFHLRYNATHRGAEREIFPHLQENGRPGIVTFTATRWKSLLNPKKMPGGEPPPSPVDCYRFVLSNPAVDVCMMGAKNVGQMRENLEALDSTPMRDDELSRMRRIGDHIHG